MIHPWNIMYQKNVKETFKVPTKIMKKVNKFTCTYLEQTLSQEIQTSFWSPPFYRGKILTILLHSSMLKSENKNNSGS